MAYLLNWDKEGERWYETGTKNGVLYPFSKTETTITTAVSGLTNAVTTHYGKGVEWNGLTGFSQTPSGGEANPFYADDIKYLNIYSPEELGGTIEAYTYPDEFAECDGSKIYEGIKFGQQKRKKFGFCYRTFLGNDVEDEYYKLHLIYGCMASPSEKGYTTINESPEPLTFSWEITTTPVENVQITVGSGNEATVVDLKPISLVTIDSKDYVDDPTKKARFNKLLNVLYGTSTTSGGETVITNAMLPMPADVYAILTGNEPANG